MPLSAPAGGTVDLLQEELVTVPTSSVIFSPVNINADKAYTLEYTIIPNYSVPNFPWGVGPQVNGLIIGGANLIEKAFSCDVGCFNDFVPITDAGQDLMWGTITYRRSNVNNFVHGLRTEATKDGPDVRASAYGAWTVDPTTFTNITSLGLEVSKLEVPFFGVGSIFRLYRGAG